MRDVGPIQSEPPAERSSAGLPNGQPDLTDVVLDNDMYRTARLVALVVGGTVLAVVLVIVLKSLQFTPVMQKTVAATALVAAGSLIWAVILHLRNAGCRRVRRVLADSAGADLPSRIDRLLPITRSLYPQALVREVARTLAGEGQFQVTIRIAAREEMSRIAPIPMPFEPQPFDQIAEMESAEPQQRSAAPDADDDAQSSRGRATRPPVPRGIRRNLILKGGWILVAILGLSWLARALESLQHRTVTPQLMLMTIVMLAFLLVPVGHSWLTGRQWLAVPAGIVLRKGKWLKRGWDLHLFDRRKAILLAYRLYRRQWALVVADQHACEGVIGTKQELEAVLRAWLCPLAPPTLAQLSDLR
jgi:hypothetical protein